MIVISSKLVVGYYLVLTAEEWTVLCRPASMQGMIQRAHQSVRQPDIGLRVFFHLQQHFVLLYVPFSAVALFKEVGPGHIVDQSLLLLVF